MDGVAHIKPSLKGSSRINSAACQSFAAQDLVLSPQRQLCDEWFDTTEPTEYSGEDKQEIRSQTFEAAGSRLLPCFGSSEGDRSASKWNVAHHLTRSRIASVILTKREQSPLS